MPALPTSRDFTSLVAQSPRLAPEQRAGVGEQEQNDCQHGHGIDQKLVGFENLNQDCSYGIKPIKSNCEPPRPRSPASDSGSTDQPQHPY
jgi:hypothetical protein